MRAKTQTVTYAPLLVLAAFLAMASVISWQVTSPNMSFEPSPDTRVLLLNNVVVPESDLLYVSDRPIISMEAVIRYLDPSAHWDETTSTAVFTTKDRVVQMPTASLTAYVNEKPVELSVPTSIIDGRPYVPLDFLGQLMHLSVRLVEGRVLVVDKPGTPVLEATSISTSYVRKQPSQKSPIRAYLPEGTKVRVLSETRGYYHVLEPRGNLGFVPKRELEISGMYTTEESPKATLRAWSPMGDKVVLVWEHVVSKNPDTSSIAPMGAVNVVSPTWFSISDTAGSVVSRADLSYVKWAKSRGYRVWGLVENGFDPERTRAVLRDLSVRQHVIRQLLVYAELFQLDGINLDFENMYMEDRDYYTQFVRELVPLAKEAGLVVSVDVTFKSNSPTWSLCYDRAALAQVADYIIVMGYDQFSGSGGRSGPVSSLSWVRAGLRAMLAEVPAEKLVLGIPLYTRLWKEDSQGGKASSKALGMRQVQELLSAKSLSPMPDESGLKYVEYVENGDRYRLWIEDSDSVTARTRMVWEYGLAGIAAWRRGFETPEIWEVIERTLDRNRKSGR